MKDGWNPVLFFGVMPYGAILRNSMGCFWKERPFYMDFGTEEAYKDTLSKRKYLEALKAPATEMDFVEILSNLKRIRG